jgi:hypothetical protein
LKEIYLHRTEDLTKLTLYRQSKMSKSSCPPPDFEIAEKQVYINTIMRFLDSENKKETAQNGSTRLQLLLKKIVHP